MACSRCRNAQDGGRVEVLRGECLALDGELQGVRFALRSHEIAHDPRVLKTERIHTLQGDALHYEQFMVTTPTPRLARERHLEAWSRRSDR